MTRADAARALKEHGAPVETAQEFDDVLSACEQAQFAQVGQSSAVEAINRARRCVKQLERTRW